MTGPQVVAFGSGVQSMSLLVLAAEERIPYRTFLFSNVGSDSENPHTLDYFRDEAIPYAAANGLELIEIWKTTRDGRQETIFERINREDTKSIVIPMRGSETGKPGPRDCTANFKIGVIGKWLKQHGASPQNKATVAMGISTDEMHRVNALKAQPYEVLDYPLLDLRMRRDDCAAVISNAGLRVPPKSACWFCPFTKPAHWAELHRADPDLFYRAAMLESTINERQAAMGRDPLYLTRFGRPLTEAPIGIGQETLFSPDDEDHCDNGWCFT